MAPAIGPCDDFKMLNGIGFNPHPEDSDKFVQCYFGNKGQLRVAYRQCPFGQYWDQSVLTCRPSEYVECEIFSDFCWFLNKALIITCDGFGHFRNISLHQIWSVQVSNSHFVLSEKCRNLRINSYAYSNTDNCRVHWACNLGKATATCRYSPYRGCQRDPKCIDACPPSFHQDTGWFLMTK